MVIAVTSTATAATAIVVFARVVQSASPHACDRKEWVKFSGCFFLLLFIIVFVLL